MDLNNILASKSEQGLTPKEYLDRASISVKQNQVVQNPMVMYVLHCPSGCFA